MRAVNIYITYSEIELTGKLKNQRNNIIIYFNENVNNMKKTWDGIKKIVNIKNTASKTSQLHMCGKIIYDNKEIATNFSNYFVNIGPCTENSIPRVPNISPSRFLQNRNQINFVIAHIQWGDIRDYKFPR